MTAASRIVLDAAAQRALRGRSEARPTEAAAEPMAKNPQWKCKMTPSVVVPGMSS